MLCPQMFMLSQAPLQLGVTYTQFLPKGCVQLASRSHPYMEAVCIEHWKVKPLSVDWSAEMPVMSQL